LTLIRSRPHGKGILGRNKTGPVLYLGDTQKSASVWSDMSGRGNHGIVYGAGTPPPATPQALGYLFDGVDDYVDAGNGASLRDTLLGITVEAWIYPTNYTGHTSNQWVIVSKFTYPTLGWWFHLRNGGDVNFNTLDGAVHYTVTSVTIPLNQWSHVVGWSNGITNKIYINGIERASAASGTLTASNANLRIAATTTDYIFQGTIDEVRIFNRALSATEIKRLYDRTKILFGV